MTDDAHHCPVEGCDKTGSLPSVRSHISGMADDEHPDWDDVRETVEQQVDGPDDPADDPDDPEGETPTEGGTEDDDPPNGGVEAGNGEENEENDPQEMDQSTEYDQQVTESTQEETQDDDPQNAGRDEGGQTQQTQPQGGSWTPFGNPLVVGLGLVVVLAVLLAATSGDDRGEPRQVDSTVESDAEVSDIEETDDDPDGPNVETWA